MRAEFFLRLWLVLVCSHPGVPACAQEGGQTQNLPAPLTAERVIQNLVEMNAKRERALLAYEGTRRYRLQYEGFWGNRTAEMVVKMWFRAPGSKEFTIVSQSGSRWMVDNVLKSLLTSEQEGARPENARRMAPNPMNYKFTYWGSEDRGGDPTYLFSIEPRSHYKFQYRGQIWIDGKDFAIARIKGAPAKSPSFWMKNTQMEHVYGKVGDFWLPLADHSVSQLRFGGQANLTIDYTDYRITNATPLFRSR